MKQCLLDNNTSYQIEEIITLFDNMLDEVYKILDVCGQNGSASKVLKSQNFYEYEKNLFCWIEKKFKYDKQTKSFIKKAE